MAFSPKKMYFETIAKESDLDFYFNDNRGGTQGPSLTRYRSQRSGIFT